MNTFRNAYKTSNITLHEPFTELRLRRGLDAPSRNDLLSTLPSPTILHARTPELTQPLSITGQRSSSWPAGGRMAFIVLL